MKGIQSRQNEKIKLARALRRRKAREAEGLFVLEGLLHIGEAVTAGAAFEYVLAAPESFKSGFAAKLAAELEAQGVEVYEVGAELLRELSSKEHPAGLLAVMAQQFSALGDLHPENLTCGVALVAPQDPGNLGSILRSIDATGADGLIVLDGGVDAYHPSAVRAGMGAHFWKPIARTSFGEFEAWAKGHGYQVYGSSAQGGVMFDEVEAKRPFILLLGSEREGLSGEQKAICDEVLRIPMRGRASSLNLAVAAGVLLVGLVGGGSSS